MASKKGASGKGAQSRRELSAKKRVSFSVSADPDTVEGSLLSYLRQNKMLQLREAVMRAIKAYYLPWAFEDAVSKEETQVLARNAIDELEFRIFQIRRHFLAGEAYGPRLSESLGDGPPPPAAAGSGTAPEPTSSKKKALDVPNNPLATPPASIPTILEDADIDPGVLDDF